MSWTRVCLVTILVVVGLGAASMPATAALSPDSSTDTVSSVSTAEEAAASVDDSGLSSDEVVSSDENETSDDTEARVKISSPSSDDQFARGSIIPITLEFENTNRGTITLGDRSAQNVVVNETSDDENNEG